MSYNVLLSLCAWLGERLGVPCSTQVPEPRPAEFATVERTGGGYTLGRDNPYLAVQAWAETDAGAYSLALAAREAIAVLAREEIPEVCQAQVGSIYAFPDPDSRQARYQLDAYLVTRP